MGVIMGYRNIEPEPIIWYTLTGECGLYGNVSDGFEGCRSRSKSKNFPGICAPCECPLSYPADLQELREMDPEWADEYKNERDDYEIPGLVVQYREVAR